jgi:esterase/lipase
LPMTQIIPTAEPFFFTGKPGKPGCLLTHGFTGAPKEMRWMGETLNREYGFTCLGIRLAGHATHPEDMIRSRYTDWMASVEDGYHLLRGTAKKIFLIGLSMGGILSLLMSTKLEVKGVVAMSTPYKLPDDPRLRYIELIAQFLPFMPKNKMPRRALAGSARRLTTSTWPTRRTRCAQSQNWLPCRPRCARRCQKSRCRFCLSILAMMIM